MDSENDIPENYDLIHMADFLSDTPQAEEAIREIDELVLSSYLAKTNLAKAILTRVINTYIYPVRPATSDDKSEGVIFTAVVNASDHSEVLYVGEHTYKSLRYTELSEIAIKAFFDYGMMNYENNN